MELLPFPMSATSTLREESLPAEQPVHDLRELFELAFPLTSERAAESETWHDNVIPLKP